MIIELDINDMPEASRLMGRSYYFKEKSFCDPRALENFCDLIKIPVLQQEILFESTRFWGEKDKSGLACVLGLRENKIMLLFVRDDLFGRGYGARLLRFAADKCLNEFIYVDSSSASIGFYKRFGFNICDKTRVKDFISLTPMKAKPKDVVLYCDKFIKKSAEVK